MEPIKRHNCLLDFDTEKKLKKKKKCATDQQNESACSEPTKAPSGYKRGDDGGIKN